MKTLASALSLLLVMAIACAEDALMDGGGSPDGRYEFRIARDPNRDPSDYAIHIHAAKTPKPFFTLDGIGGYMRYPTAVERCRALWHQSSKFVVATDQGTRHSREIYIIAISDGHAESLPVPDYVQNALGRVNATEIDHQCVSTPARWDGDDLLLTLSFSVSTPERGRLFYTCDVILHLFHGPNAVPRIGLMHVSAPKPGNG